MNILIAGNLCGIFVDLQKALNTVDLEILLSKLDQQGIQGIANKWFETYLCNRKQYVSINGFKSNTSTLTCDAPQHTVLGLLLIN